MVLQVRHFEQQIINTWEVLKCGAGERSRSFVTIEVKNEIVLYREKKERNIMLTMKGRRAIGLFETAVETVQ